MPRIEVITRIRAPIALCFDLARNIDVHIRSTEGTEERAIAGVTTGPIGMGEEVTWETRHFCVKQRLTSRITRFDRPWSFRDSQVRGPFRRFDHDHLFTQEEGGITVMNDVFEYEAPFGWLGVCTDWVFLTSYMRRLLEARAVYIKAAAETVG